MFCNLVENYPAWEELRQRLEQTLQWRHNERDGVSNHQPHDCLLNRLFRRRSKKTSKLRVTGESPTQRASNTENVPFDDIIMNMRTPRIIHTVFALLWFDPVRFYPFPPYKYWISKMFVRYIMSSVCLRKSQFLNYLSRNIRGCVYVPYLIFIIKSEVRTIGHLALDHDETMACTVCLSMFLWLFY